MADVGSPLSYYLRAMGSFIGYWNLLAIFNILSGIFLLFLAYLILKANPQKTKNRFMALILVTEAIRCFTAMLFWLYAWPEEALNFLIPARVAYYTMSLQLSFCTRWSPLYPPCVRNSRIGTLDVTGDNE